MPKVGIVYVLFLYVKAVLGAYMIYPFFLQCGEWLFHQDTVCLGSYNGE